MAMPTTDAEAFVPGGDLPWGRLAGGAALAMTVTIWAGFALSVRAIGTSPLSTADVALIRFLVPAILLLPFLPSRWPALRRVRPLDALLLAGGAGLPFFWLASAGGALTSAAHVGALIAGTTPIAVAILARVIEGHRVEARRLGSLGVIGLGVAILAAAQPMSDQGSVLGGVTILLGASLLWGAYALGLRRAGLDAIGCVLLLSLPSAAALLVLAASGAVTLHLHEVPWRATLPFVVVQGLGVGALGGLAYAFAIARLGAARSAAVGSLAPVLAAIGAVPLLGEALTPAILGGVAVITSGVLLTTRP